MTKVEKYVLNKEHEKLVEKYKKLCGVDFSDVVEVFDQLCSPSQTKQTNKRSTNERNKRHG